MSSKMVVVARGLGIAAVVLSAMSACSWQGSRAPFAEGGGPSVEEQTRVASGSFRDDSREMGKGEVEGKAEERANGAVTSNAESWAEIDRLIEERKYRAALDRVQPLLVEARQANRATEWARALVRIAQLRTGLESFETAVDELRRADWPAASEGLLAVELYYVEALRNYLRTYRWEIGQRERIASSEEADFDSWTEGQIVAEALRVLNVLWQRRDDWGDRRVGALGAYLEANDFPEQIRGTLRDTVSYLLVELLADRSLWTASQSSRLYLLSRDELLGAAAAVDGELSAEHPLLALTEVLGDLEAWHLAADREEAAFAARLERLVWLRGALTEASDRSLVESTLSVVAAALPKQYEWWSVAQLQRARWTRERDDPNALLEARQIALAGAEQHPDGYSAGHCRRLIREIETPEFTLEAGTVDGFGKRSIRIQHRNIEQLHLRMYALDWESWIARTGNWSLLPDQGLMEETVSSSTPVARWSVDLPETPDFRSHATYTTPSVDRPGLFVLAASLDEQFAFERNRLSAVPMVLGDPVLFAQSAGERVRLAVRSGETGRLHEEAELLVYRFDPRAGHQLIERRIGGKEPWFDLPAGQRQRNQRFFAIGRVEGAEGVVWTAPVSLTSRVERQAEDADDVLLFVDRPAYRPGQKILFKVLAFRGQRRSGSYQLQPKSPLTVQLSDANGEVVESLAVETDRFGSAFGEIAVPAGRLLGGWSLSTDRGGWRSVVVEEYKRPTFEVEFEAPIEPRLNREVAVAGRADYYFGLPVAGAEVEWSVIREPVYSYGWRARRRPVPASAPERIAAGVAEVASDGSFTLQFDAAADERLAEVEGTSYRFRVEASVTDGGGETRSGSRSFEVGFVAVRATISAARAVFRSGETLRFDLQRTDLEGRPLAGIGSWSVAPIEQPETTPLPADLPAFEDDEESVERYRTPGDLLRPRWQGDLPYRRLLASWATGASIGSGELSHPADGQAAVELESLPPGSYRLRYQTEDVYGARVETLHDFVVAVSPLALDRPVSIADPDGAPLRVPLLLEPESDAVEVGETARWLVHSGLADQELIFELFQGDRQLERIELAGGDPQWVELPVAAAWRGGVAARLTALRDHQLLVESRSLEVPWSDRRLELEWVTFRDRLRPGDSERWTVRLRAPEGAAVNASPADVELLAYAYDRSLEAIAPFNPTDPTELLPSWGGPPSWIVEIGSHRQSRGERRRTNLPVKSWRSDRLIFFDRIGLGRGVRQMRARGVMAEADEVMQMESVAAPAAQSSPLAAKAAPAGDGPTLSASDGSDSEAPRSDFRESAFWIPKLMLSSDGVATIEFQVPDSLTDWQTWVHAVGRDLSSGVLQGNSRTAKELVVRPYLPRFVREGDRLELVVLVQNTGEKSLDGELTFGLEDPTTESSMLAEFGLAAGDTQRSFSVAPGGETRLRFALQVPERVGEVAVVARATARTDTDTFSDGERRALPILPRRLFLSQSRFTSLDGPETRPLRFDNLIADAERQTPLYETQQMVVTLDGQLFDSVLAAVPYLVDYPYECTEQTLNRFLGAGILSSLFDRYPQIAAGAKQLAERETELEPWGGEDPNRAMLLEETPWLVAARGGSEDRALVKILDPEVAAEQRRIALAKLTEQQLSSGAFSWWPGGPPSPYMTLYLLEGFARARQFGIEVPQPMVVEAWRYVYEELWPETTAEESPERLAFLAYVLSSYPDAEWTGDRFGEAERQKILESAFAEWKRFSLRLKSYVALALQRSGRTDDAENVFASVLDAAQTTEEGGTFWAPEERAWLWYRDTVENHAFALRALLEIDPEDPRLRGLVHWLFLDKKLSHWKSTRATSEAVYALATYLEQTGELGAAQALELRWAGETTAVRFESGGERRKQIVLDRDALQARDGGPAAWGEIEVEQSSSGIAFASATWQFATDELPLEARGDLFQVSRTFYRRVVRDHEVVLEPIAEGAEITLGDEIEVELRLVSRHGADYVHLRDPRGAGFEPVVSRSGYRWDRGIGRYEEVRDSGVNFFFEWLPAGEVTLRHRLRATTAGRFRVGPATVQSMYAPEFVAYSAGAHLDIQKTE